MSDDQSRARQQDRARVAASEDHEVRHLMEKHGKDRATVVAAIEKAGPMREDVERELTGKG